MAPGEKIPYTGKPTENPNDRIVPGKMRSDREELPEGYTKEQADLAEIAEAKALQQKQQQRSAQRSATSLAAAAAPTDCMTYWPENRYQVCGLIRVKYDQLGGPTGFLLLPTSNELTNPGNTGKHSTFVNGPIYWSAAGGAHPVVNHFFAAWQRNGWEAGVLRYPTTDEIVNPDGVGRRQEFQGGTVYWRLNEAYFVGGAIKDRWLDVGGERNGSLLGYPTSDEIRLPDGVGRMNRFERGVLYWHPSTGARPVVGEILNKWAGAGYERGTFGYPSVDQLTRDNGATVEQQFQRGLITAPGGAAIELARLNVGATAEAMIQAARNFGGVLIDTLNNALAASLLALPETPAGDPSPGENEILPTPRGPGDIFFSESATLRVNHGHNGIFETLTTSIEASNGSGVQRRDNAVNGGRQMRSPQMGWVNTSGAVRQGAVAHAVSKIGKGYNNNFAFNKNINDEQYNCSQLLWAAYQHASGNQIDLDGDGGPGVYPRDIFKSGWVTRYPE